MKSSSDAPFNSQLDQVIWIAKEVTLNPLRRTPSPLRDRFAPLRPLRQWLDDLEITDSETAHLICRLIPARCPFERTVTAFGRTILSIPPLCKLNPLYDQFVGLRFRSLCYLSDVCGEDISAYC